MPFCILALRSASGSASHAALLALFLPPPRKTARKVSLVLISNSPFFDSWVEIKNESARACPALQFGKPGCRLLDVGGEVRHLLYLPDFDDLVVRGRAAFRPGDRLLQ